MFPLFHMAGWNFASMAWSARHAAHLVSRADAEQLLGAVERWSAGHLVLHTRRVASDPRERRRVDVSSVEWALTGTSQVTHGAAGRDQGALPGHADDGQLRLDRDGPGRCLAATPTCSPIRGASASPSPECRPAWPTTASCCCASDRLMTGYFDLPSETAEVLRDGWYHTGDLAEHGRRGLPVHRRPKEGGHPHRRRDGGPGRGRGGAGRLSRGRRGGGRSASPTPSGARWSAPSSSLRRGGRAARASRACGPTSATVWPRTSTHAGWSRPTSCRGRSATGQVQRAKLARQYGS